MTLSRLCIATAFITAASAMVEAHLTIAPNRSMASMVDSSANVYMSFNQVYMAVLMAAPMVVIELIVMRAMYEDARLNRILIAASVVLGIGMFLLIREQTAIDDRQFLHSMIPHHSGAILICREATIVDPELKTRCQEIIVGQQREIDQMIAKLSGCPSSVQKTFSLAALHLSS